MHIPVLLSESLEALSIKPDLSYVDATVGGGGHFREILSCLSNKGEIIGFDRDLNCIEELKGTLPENAKLIHSNYKNISRELEAIGISTISGGILADLGVSSMQLDNPERGFSFQSEAPLDMRMDESQPLTAEQLINTYEEKELSDIIYRYGEERHSRRIANAIVRNRPITSTLQLSEVVSKTLNRFQKRGTKRNMTSGAYRKREKHPATRTFQAIRIAVNDELKSLENFLGQAVTLLKPGARLAIITFHSLEDRIVKQFLKYQSLECICPPGFPICKCSKTRDLRLISRKPITATTEELEANPRSRSAKLRVAERL